MTDMNVKGKELNEDQSFVFCLNRVNPYRKKTISMSLPVMPMITGNLTMVQKF